METLFNTLLLGTIVLLVLGLLLLVFLSRRRKTLGSLTGTVLYDSEKDEPIQAKTMPVIAKPDFILQKNEGLIPVEYKTSKTPATPYPNHVMQLIAYCLVTEEHFGKRPPYGIVKYPEREFIIDYTPQLETILRDIVTEMIAIKKETEPTLFDQDDGLCRKCRIEAQGALVA